MFVNCVSLSYMVNASQSIFVLTIHPGTRALHRLILGLEIRNPDHKRDIGANS